MVQNLENILLSKNVMSAIKLISGTRRCLWWGAKITFFFQGSKVVKIGQNWSADFRHFVIVGVGGGGGGLRGRGVPPPPPQYISIPGGQQ